MERMMDDDDLAQEVIDEFLADIPCQIEALKAAVEAADSKAAERKAHSIKGAAANMATEGLRAVAADIETSGKAGDVDTARSLLPQLEDAFERVKKEMGTDHEDSPC